MINLLPFAILLYDHDVRQFSNDCSGLFLPCGFYYSSFKTVKAVKYAGTFLIFLLTGIIASNYKWVMQDRQQ